MSRSRVAATGDGSRGVMVGGVPKAFKTGRRSPVHEKGNAWIRTCELMMFNVVRLLGRRHYQGMENITIPGPILIVMNHVSHLDPIYDAVFIRKSGRMPHILAKASLWKIPVVGSALRGTGMIPVERGGGRGQTGLDEAVASLEAGKVVLIYPEGTITRDPGQWPMRPRPGVAALALAGDFPVIPMARWGTQEVFRPYAESRKFRPLPRKDIYLRAGTPLDLSEYRGKPVDARAIRDVSFLIMAAVRDLLAEIRQEEPPTAFFDPKKAERLEKQASRTEPVDGSAN